MTTWTLYIAKPAKPGTGTGTGAFATPVAQGLTIDDTNILTVNPGLNGAGPSSVSTATIYLQRWLYRVQNQSELSRGYEYSLSSDGGTTFIKSDG